MNIKEIIITTIADLRAEMSRETSSVKKLMLEGELNIQLKALGEIHYQEIASLHNSLSLNHTGALT